MTLNTSESLRNLPLLGACPWWMFAVPFYIVMGADPMCISVYGHVAWLKSCAVVVLNSSCHITQPVIGTSFMSDHFHA